MSTDNERVVRTACQMGPSECGMTVHVRDGEVTKVEGMREHPYNKGRLCIRGSQAREYLYHPDRIKYPMKKENGQWKRMSWDEALDLIANKLTEIREKYGPTALAACIGDPVQTRGLTGLFTIWRFLDAYGSPNMFLSDPCYRVRCQAQNLTFGFLRYPFCADVENSRCIILWAHNPQKSEPQIVPRIEAARKNGSKLIVIDCRRTQYAKTADIHVMPRPGTDAIIMLAMINTIISEGLYDKDFVEKWTTGFDQLAEHIKQYPPEKAEEVSGVPADKIREIARMFAITKPACIQQGWGCLDQVESGFQNSRANCILHAITGNVDRPGGILHVALPVTNFPRLFDRLGDVKPPLSDEYPLFGGPLGLSIASATATIVWIDTLFTEKPYPIKAMYVAGSNPMVNYPNTSKVKRALETLDFLLVMDIFMTPTAEMADVVLPAATFLERTDIIHIPYASIAAVPYAMLGEQAVPEMYESWPDWKFVCELGRRMGYGEDFPWQTVEELIEYYLEPSDMSVRQLKEESPTGVRSGTVEDEEYWRQHPDQPRFPTPSGKVELYCETLKGIGSDPLPIYIEPEESPVSSPDVAKDYPLVLTTGARVNEYWHSCFHRIAKLWQRTPEPVAEINPESAAKYGVADGQMVILETRRGRIELKASVTEDIMPGVVSIPHGWAEANANVLTDDAFHDRQSGYPNLHALLCRVGSA